MANHSATEISLGNLLVRLLAVMAVLAGLLFIPAGRLDWLQAWLFILAFGGFLLFYGIWGLCNDPAQLAERSRRGGNAKGWDRLILAAYTVLLVAMLVVAGLDAGRFGWAPAPLWLQVAGWLGLALAGGIVWWTASVNTYLSRVVRIQDDRGQQVITTGSYRYVRHPMYVGVILMMLSLPMVLGSLAALVPGALIAVLFVIRTALEDRTLQAELPGYAEYARRVRYRLLPGVW
jgi:protein-S-isoprenylcysteine O-methyltransferase Ste14